MLYYQIKNYEDFKKRFGLTTRENGVISRKNKILLGHLKNPLLLRYCLKHNDYSLLHSKHSINSPFHSKNVILLL